MVEIFNYSLSHSQLALLAVVSFLLGMAKVGVAGMGMLVVPIMAVAFGAKASTGLILTILIFADIIGVAYFHQHAHWKSLQKLLPTAIVGVVIGTVLGDIVDERIFRLIMVAIIFCVIPLMVWQEQHPNRRWPDSVWFTFFVGVLGGIATMIGNLAGPIMAIYLLSMRFPKNQFIGTAAWFFLVVNVSKVPFHAIVWQTITIQSFLLTAVFIPAVLMGAWTGLAAVKRIPEAPFRWFIISMSIAAALSMLVQP